MDSLSSARAERRPPSGRESGRLSGDSASRPEASRNQQGRHPQRRREDRGIGTWLTQSGVMITLLSVTVRDPIDARLLPGRHVMSRITRRALCLLTTSAIAVGTVALAGDGAAVATTQVAAARKPPSHVLMVLFDQMRPEYADRFNMPNFRRLRAQGSDFKNASLGYMGAETVVAH